MRNLGPKTASWLRVVGIESQDDLAAAGAVEAWVRLRDAGFRPSRLALWAMQGALLDIDWRDLPDEMKEQLLTEVDRLERAGSRRVYE